MAILINKNTKVLIQGITGNEGSRACKEMRAYGTAVVAGVTPGKGGQNVENVPVYNTVLEALAAHPDINTSLITVPAPFAKDAALEAIDARIPLIDMLTEHVPTQDAAYIIAAARRAGTRIVGPSSVGIISPGLGKIGSIGSGGMKNVFTPGPIGVISKSGGMTAEISATLTRAKLGQSTVIGIGGDAIIGSDFVDLLKLFQEDPETKAVVLFGEVGGTYEERAAEFVKRGGLTKPLVALVAGKFTETLPQGTVLGHAGAIVSRGRGSYASKVKALRGAGIMVADILDEVPGLLRKSI